MKTLPVVGVLLFGLVLAGCGDNPKRDQPRNPFGAPKDSSEVRAKARKDDKLDAEALYRRARATLDTSDFSGAIEEYDNLSKRFPFSDVATQGELERIYALYRTFEPDRALSAADRFQREHPRHPAVDYVQYVKGLINFNREDSALSLLPIDESKADVGSLRRSWDDFATLLQRYPKSPYAGDAYQRMVFIRGRLAEHELHVVDFYIRRGAYVAAAKRAEQIIAQYPGTPSSLKALEALQTCYENAGMTAQAEDARRLLAGQTARSAAAAATPEFVPTSVASVPPPPAAAP